MSERLVYHGNDRGEIKEISREDSYSDDEGTIVLYYVWVKQEPEPEDE